MDVSKHISLLIGYNGIDFHFVEIGIALNQYGRVGYHPGAWSIFFSNEIKLDDKIFIGPKIGCWAGGGVAGLAMGVNLIYYTDFTSSTLRFRPEIGVGFDRFKVVYGNNIPLTNKNFERVNRNLVAIAILFSVKKLKDIRR